MIKQSELEVMVCDLFVDAYRAGQSCGDLAYNAARGTRANLINKIRDVYAELESESYHREQFEVELKTEQENRQSLYETIRKLDAEIQRLNEEIRKLTLTDPENPDSPAWSDFTPGPDDMEPELRDCLPFPDVEDLEGASGLLGGDE